MSNLPPKQFTNVTGPTQLNANNPPQYMSNSQVPSSQLPPGYVSVNQDANSNSPRHMLQSQNAPTGHLNNFNTSASSSPAFNNPGIIAPPQMPNQPLPTKPPHMPPMQMPVANPITSQNLPPASRNPNVSSSSPYPSSSYQQPQINDNAPPLAPPSSLLNRPLVNGPPMTLPPSSNASQALHQYPVASAASIPSSTAPFGQGPQRSMPLVHGPPGPVPSQPNVTGPPLSMSHRATPPMFGSSSLPPTSATVMQPTGVPQSQRPVTMNGPLTPPQVPVPGQMNQPSNFGPSRGPFPPMPVTGMTPASGSVSFPQSSTAGPPINSSIRPPMNTSMPPVMTGQVGPQAGVPPVSASGVPPSMGPPPNGPFSGPIRPPNGPPVPPSSTPSFNQGSIKNGYPTSTNVPAAQGLPQMPPMLNQPQPPGPVHQGLPPGPSVAPMGSNMANRYPQMPGNYYQQPSQPAMGQQYQYGTQGLTQQMGQLSVTKQGFDQLWGHQMVDLLQTRHILPEYPEDPPEIKLGPQFAEASNCSPEIFRCTVNRIPETNTLLQKSRLPLGILIHPFKDLNHLPVIQCNTIVRCRACRTYINPFVYFVDAKRWKCNLCYRVNDLPEEFQYDPVSKSYGDPTRRPEVRAATIEFIAPGEYMLRPPQPAVYLFLLDVSHLARECGYLQVVCDTIKARLEELPGDARTQVGFLCYDAHVHYYLMGEGLTRPKEMTVLDVDDIFLPSPEALLVNLGERAELVKELLSVLPRRYAGPGVPASALGPALQAAYKLMAPTGGRITVFQTCLPNVGPGALQPREDPNARSAKEVSHLNPATDFYKRLALDCSGAQVAVDLFLLNSQYADLATLSGMSKFSAGTVYHMPLFQAARRWQAEQLTRALSRYLTRKIGFEAVMRVRCTRGISIHTFHGNFFVRSTDLLSLPNVSPDAGFAMQLAIEESLSDLNQVCFQAALLYTSSKGERRIRVHTLALPIASSLPDVLHSADQQCIIGLLSKMAVDRCASATMSEAREALTNVAIDALSAFRLAQNLPAGANSANLLAPHNLRLLPLYLHALLRRKAFRTGTSTRLDDRVSDMGCMKCLPLPQLLQAVHPDLYEIHTLSDHLPREDDDQHEPGVPDPPRMHLTAERINSTGAYLLDDGETMIIYVCHAVSASFLSDTLGVTAFSQLADESRALPVLDSPGNALLHAFVERLNDERPYAANILILRDNSPNRTIFTEKLVEDRVDSAFSYYEFLQHVKSRVK